MVRLSKTRPPTESLRVGLVCAGWFDLDNARERVKVDHREIELVGTDDAHIRLDRYHHVAGPADPSADLSLGVTHAPYRRVLDPTLQPAVSDHLDIAFAQRHEQQCRQHEGGNRESLVHCASSPWVMRRSSPSRAGSGHCVQDCR